MKKILPNFTLHQCKNVLKYAIPFVLVIFAYLYAYIYTTPSFTNGRQYKVIENQHEFSYPLLSFGTGITLGSVDMYVHKWHPSIYHFVPDDCLIGLRINNQDVLQGKAMCDWKKGESIDLHTYIVAGKNKVEFKLSNNSGELSLHIRPSSWDSLVFAVHIVFLSIICSMLLWWLRPIRKKISTEVLYVLLAGIALRWFYFLLTPYKIRSHDVDGHVEYILYVLQHWQIPPIASGWQFYQPPLYYFFTSILLLPAKLLGANNSILIDLMQGISLLLSIASLLIATWVAYIVFTQKEENTNRVLFIGIIAALPSLVFSASRISNDTLLLPIWFLLFGFLLRFWNYKTKKDWYAVVIIFAFAVLTKWNVLALAPLLGLCFIIQYYSNWREMLKICSVSAIIFFACTGMLFFKRIIIEGQSHIIGNINSNNPALFIKDWTPLRLITLKPVEMIKYPYNDPWDDTYGRGYYWLYMPKSVFTGEWNFGPKVNKILQVILLINMALCLLVAVEILYDIWKNRLQKLPIWGTIFTLIGASFAIQMNKHNGGLQDFRYLTLLALPVTYFILLSTQRSKIFRIIFNDLLILFIGLLFVVTIMIANT